VLSKYELAIFWALTFVRLSAMLFFGCQILITFRGAAPATIIPFVAILVTALVAQGTWFLLPLAKKPEPTAAGHGWRVAVVTTYSGRSESLKMLAGTLQALRRITYPHDTWLLDESDSEPVRLLCTELGVRHFTRKHQKAYNLLQGKFEAGTKHANYNAWLDSVGYSQYEVLCAFDPDHVPDPSFLSKVMGCFSYDYIAYVQVPQVYYNHSWGPIPEEQLRSPALFIRTSKWLPSASATRGTPQAVSTSAYVPSIHSLVDSATLVPNVPESGVHVDCIRCPMFCSEESRIIYTEAEHLRQIM
jgi:hypothetical protein